MGTRSLTHVKADIWREGEEPRTLVTIYRQYDGYPTGMGADLAAFLSGRRIVNGLSGDDDGLSENGMGELAAHLVAALKADNPSGNVYIYPPDASDCGEEYVYTITNKAIYGFGGGSDLHLRCEGYGRALFDGPVAEFDAKAVEAAR